MCSAILKLQGFLFRFQLFPGVWMTFLWPFFMSIKTRGNESDGVYQALCVQSTATNSFKITLSLQKSQTSWNKKFLVDRVQTSASYWTPVQKVSKASNQFSSYENPNSLQFLSFYRSSFKHIYSIWVRAFSVKYGLSIWGREAAISSNKLQCDVWGWSVRFCPQVWAVRWIRWWKDGGITEHDRLRAVRPEPSFPLLTS